MNTSIKKESVCPKFLCAWDVLPSKVFFLLLVILLCMVTACSDDDSKTAGGSTEDQNTIAIEDMTIVGVSQKGPFIRGAKVLAYELQDGETLKQTGKNFVGSITRDDGLFDVRSVSLMSQYVYMSVNGFYLNEVTGQQSDAPVLLQAITDLTLRDETNINLLTHLEYERVLVLVDREKMTIKDAKAQAESEVMKAFYIDLSLKNNFEDLNIFSTGDDNAALLAISIMMQGDLKEAAFSERLTYFAQDIENDGEWNNEKVKAAIADWVSTADYEQIRRNVESWELGDEVPPFEKYLNNFWWQNFGLGDCSKKNQSEIKQNSNEKSVYYESFFICDADGWRLANDLEKDTYGLQEECSQSGKYGDGSIVSGLVNSDNKYVCDADTFRVATEDEVLVDKGCTSYTEGLVFVPEGYVSYYKCHSNLWSISTGKLITGTITDERDGQKYKTVGIGNQVWMAENLNYNSNFLPAGASDSVINSWCYDDDVVLCEKYGRLYLWSAAMDSAGITDSNGAGLGCTDEFEIEKCFDGRFKVRGVCPKGWRLPSGDDFAILVKMAGGKEVAAEKLKSTDGWPEGKNGSDDYGFSVLPAGGAYWGSSSIDFRGVQEYAEFWTTGYKDNYIISDFVETRYNLLHYIRSVRCIKDSD